MLCPAGCRVITYAKTSVALFALSLMLATMRGADAQGGPPMLTDDPDTPGANHWEINTAFTLSDTHAEQSRSFPHVDINYGLGDSLQLKYETGWLFVQTPEPRRASGLDNSLIGVKWRFVGRDDDAFKASIYPQYEFQNGTHSVERGIAEPAPNLLLPLELSGSFGRVSLVAELGYQFLHDARNEWVYGLLGAFRVSEALELLAEIHGTTDSRPNNWDSVVNVGLRRSLTDRLKLLASVGTGLNNEAETTKWTVYLGFQLLLGRNAHDSGR